MRVLLSREFWRAFAHYWSGPEISHRIDLWVSSFRERHGQDPSPEIEGRLNDYRQKKASSQDTRPNSGV